MILNMLWSVAPCAPAPPSRQADKISPLIHLVYGLWDEGRLPLRYRPMLGSWLRRHRPPHWRVVLWNRTQAEELVDSRFPELAKVYRDFERPVQRADLLRYLLLYEYGGFYADLDIVCVNGLKHMLRQCPGASMLVQVEKVLSPQRATEIGRSQVIRQGRPEIEVRIANYFMGCQAGHPMMAEIIELVRERSHLKPVVDYDVLYTTGPDVVSEVIHKNRQEPGLRILSQARAQDYVRHYCWGSWRQF